MKQYLLLIILLSTTSLLLGQQNALTTITTAGGFEQADNGISVSWTMGEVFSHTELNSIHITEGFQQGDLASTGTIELSATRLNDQSVQLNWEEIGTVYAKEYTIQRSIGDANSFRTIATLNNNFDRTKEILIDENSSELITYYRIKFKEETKNLQTNKVPVDGIERIIQVNTFPNPTTNYLQVGFNHEVNGFIEVSILSLSGKIVFQKLFDLSKNQLVTITEVAQFSKGEYFLKVSQDNELIAKSSKFIKL